MFGAIYRAVLAVEATKATAVTEVSGREALSEPPAPAQSDGVVHCLTTPAR